MLVSLWAFGRLTAHPRRSWSLSPLPCLFDFGVGVGDREEFEEIEEAHLELCLN